MEAHIHEWLNLLLRWIHFIVGIAWIGASFYFNWLENNLDRNPPQDEGISGNLWAVHGGGFYHLKKFSVGPDSVPDQLHWFKWEAYTTWLSGFSLLVVVYYFNARVFLIDPAISAILPWQAMVLGIGSLLVSWLVYDGLCRSPLRRQPVTLAALVFAWFVGLAWVLSETLSGRAAFIHVGAAIGTVMVANVFFVIIPAQREMVSALAAGRPLDPSFGHNGLLRSRHNNYLTLPVLFTMISSHFPSTYGHHWNWLVLLLVSVCGVATRHYFNVRKQRTGALWLLPAAFAGMVAIMMMTAPKKIQAVGESGSIAISDERVMEIVSARCVSCHALVPTQPGFSAPPKGLVLESIEQVVAFKDLIHQTTVVSKIMPIGNLTGMTDREREQIERWIQSQ